MTADIPAIQPAQTRMTRDISDILRRHFPPEQIGKLPRGRTELDYVGHSDVTSRLLEADPEWTWGPVAYDENNLPRFDLDNQGNPVGFWIRLTVAGVTRLGYGSVPSDQRDAVKVLIGDALRNAAMRFGVAVDLWAKGDRQDPTRENPSGSAAKAVRGHSRAVQDAIQKPRITADPNARGGKIIHLPIGEMVAKTATLTTVDEWRDHWALAGMAGYLTKDIAHPKTGEKLPFQDYLTQYGEQLRLKSGNSSAGKDTRASAGDK